jgi:aryl-alcohol dehydrogenase-like predicted oxidoreductase
MTRQQLALGTAQFGLDYGITNAAGRVPPPEVAKLLRAAWDGGVRTLDTAHAYGDSEAVLGECMQDGWQIVTKTLPLRGAAIGEPELERVADAFRHSLQRLRVQRVGTLLVHHAQDLLVPGGDALYAWLAEQKRAGTAGRIGASVYDGAEIAALLDRFALDAVQLPASVADQRLVADGSLSRLRAAGVEVHVRSLFLQGVLLAPPEFGARRFPQQAAWLAAFHAECTRRGLTPQQACLSFFKSREEFTVAVAGVSNAAELSQLLGAWESAPAMDWSGWAVDNRAFLDPRLWNAPS